MVKYQSSRLPYETTASGWCGKSLSAVLDEVKVTDDWWLKLSPLEVTSSGSELFVRSRKMFTGGV